MKSLIASLILFSLMIIGVIANAFAVRGLTEELSVKIEALDTPDVSSAQSFLDFWLSHAEWVRLSAGFAATDRITEQAMTLLASAEVGDVFSYHTALALLSDAIEDLARHERFSFENLL